MNKICLLSLVFIVMCLSCGKKKKNSSLARNYYKMALLELSDGHDDEWANKKALGCIENAIQQEKKAEYVAMKATLLFRLGQGQESDSYFKEALQLCEGAEFLKTEILNNYACLLVTVGRGEQALSIWKDLENNRNYLTPEVALVNQGKFHAMNNNVEKAKKCFSKAIYLSPNFLDAHYYLALVSYSSGDLSTTKNELKTVLFLNSEHDGAKRFLQQVFHEDLKQVA
jgi:Tfp pilus assembly protein PilF